jgi:ornithine carbamoyltransferase
LWAAKRLGFQLAIASPVSCQPPAEFLTALDAPNVSVTADPRIAVTDAHVINTDVWLSMGQEQQQDKEREFAGFEVNAGLLASAAAGHIVLHCLPAYRGKEISAEILELHAATIFQQAENRLHAQKAILVALVR